MVAFTQNKFLEGEILPNFISSASFNKWEIFVGITALADCLRLKVLNDLTTVNGKPIDL